LDGQRKKNYSPPLSDREKAVFFLSRGEKKKIWLSRKSEERKGEERSQSTCKVTRSREGKGDRRVEETVSLLSTGREGEDRIGAGASVYNNRRNA